MKFYYIIIIFLFPVLSCFAQDSKSKSIDTALEANTRLLNDLLKLRTSINKKAGKTEKQPAKPDSVLRKSAAKSTRRDSVIKIIIPKDTITVKQAIDTFIPQKDSIGDTGRANRVVAGLLAVPGAKVQDLVLKGDYSALLDHPYLAIKATPVYYIVNEKRRLSKDQLFYLTGGLLLFLAFVKLAFPKYFTNIFRLFFQPSFRQKQTREQLIQSNLPSLLFNLFFVFSAGSYSALLLQHHELTQIEFWRTLIYCSAIIGIIYLMKYLFLTFSGWVFNVKEATDKYIFIVYLINKILGVVLIPFILILAFSQQNIIDVAITVSIIMMSFLYLYRYIVSYGPISRDIKVSPVHFLFFISAFEIIPLLLIYKLLMIYLDISL